MATSNADIKTRIAELRAEILSYKPGKAKPCYDEQVVFPEKLVIGVITGNTRVDKSLIVPVLRRALHGDVEESNADERIIVPSTDDQEQYITDYISAITKTCYSQFRDLHDEALSRLVAKVDCVVLCLDGDYLSYWPRWIQQVKKITGHPPICYVYDEYDVVSHKGRNILIQQGITGIYEAPYCGDRSPSDQVRFNLLSFLHGCLVEGDVRLAHDVDNVHKNVSSQQVSESDRKRVIEAKQEITEKNKEKGTLQQEYNDLETKHKDVSSSRDKLINENSSLRNELKDVREKKDETEMAMAEIKNTAKHMEEMYKKNEVKYENELRSTNLRVDALIETVKKTEETAKKDIEGLKADRETERVRFQEENQSTELVMKGEIASKDLNIEQLEREIWKLRTKIQLESEMRSAEQKKKSEKPQWLESIIPWIASGKQAQTGTSATRESSEGKPPTSTCDDLLLTEEQPNDDFADILKQIADDLYDDSKIDSLGGQLGILLGDIERALKTNYRFHRITSEGTRQMLQQWRRGVSREDERRSLRRALLAAKLVDLADQYVPEETGSNTEKEHPKVVILSPETNEDTTTIDHRNAPLQFDPPTNTNEDTSTTDDAPLQVDPSSETNEKVVHESINSQASGDLSKPSTTDVHHESEDISSHDTLGEGFPTSGVREDITTGYQDLICHLASNETSSDKLLIIFCVNVLLNIPHRAFGL